MKQYKGIRILTTTGKTTCHVPFDGTTYQFPNIDCAKDFIDYCLNNGVGLKADGALTV